MPTRSASVPNVVVMIMDDLAYGDLACHGNPYTRTPHLDALHHAGTRLTRYCSGPLCTPARAALMTGRHPYRTRAIDTYLGRSTIDPEERTLAEVLHDAGYATGLFGKWHLGDCYPSRPPDKGFDESLYHTGGGLQQPANAGRSSYFDPDLLHNGRLTPSSGYCTDVFTDAALAFIEQHQTAPFFVYLATNAPHSPFEVPDEWTAQYRPLGLPEKLCRLYGMVENIDHNFGRVAAKLDELGLAGDTIVVYTSDHGPCPSAQIDGQIRWNAGLRGMKGQMYEGGLKVPCFWRWPGHILADHDVDRVANPIDVLPTLAAACGASVPDDRVIDGRDLLPLLTGAADPTAWPDRSICLQWQRGDLPQLGRNGVNVRQQYKWYQPHETKPAELYDLTADPGETRDLAAELPDVAAAMRAEYEAWFTDVSTTRGATPADNYAPPPIHLGTPHESPTFLTRQDWRLYGDREGWADDLPGYWPVVVAAGGEYAITVDLPPRQEAGLLTVRCGSFEVRRQLEAAMPVCHFGQVRLAAGAATFEAYLQVGSTRLGVQMVRVRKVADRPRPSRGYYA